MSDFWDGAGIVAKKALTWACYGALAFGAVAVLPSMVASLVGWAGSAVSFGTAGGAAMSVLLPAITTGALLGGVLGTIKGASDLPDELADKDREIADNKRIAAIDQRRAAVEQSQQQAPVAQAEAGVAAPNVGAAQGQAVVAAK